MREIKFRAWNKRTKKMLDLQAVTPLATELKGLFIPFDEELEIMQYTGLKDYAAREIYEGELLIYHRSSDEAYIFQALIGHLALE